MQNTPPYIGPLEQHRANIGWNYADMVRAAKGLGRTISAVYLSNIEKGRADEVSSVIATTIAMTINHGYGREEITPVEVLQYFQVEREKYLQSQKVEEK